MARLAVHHLADEAVVFVAREGGDRVGAVAHRDPAERDALGRVAEWYAGGRAARRTPLGRAARTNTIQQVEPLTDEAMAEAAGQDPTLAGDLHRVRAGYAAMVPLTIRNRVQAVLFLGRTAMEGALDGDDQALVEEVARRMARAIENARLYRERDEIAEALQRNLLPTVENPPGLDLALTYVSSAEGAEVGGDFFDLFALDDGDWLAAIGDVCGKGIEAAALMGIARHTLRAVALPDRSPDRILAALNRALVAQYEDQRFCTVCCARIRIGDRGMTAEVTSGGHPLPVILRRDGRVEHAGLHGALLGVFPDPELACTTVRLEPGDLLVLYTDGIEQPGATAEERVLDVVGRMAGAGPQDVIDALVAEYRKDHRRSDDFAAMALGVPGDGPSS